MTLQDVITICKTGYAVDIAKAILESTLQVLEAKSQKKKDLYVPSVQDADSLFRTLVLDERFFIADAKEAYEQAMKIIVP